MVRIGTSGWKYRSWCGLFYPKGLAHARELEYASACFDSVEVNGTFYSLTRPNVVARWHDETPDDFVFAVKGSRFITHMKQLKDIETPLANFFASGLLAFEEKLGPILWQLPPRMKFDRDKLARFFDALPRTTQRAARLAKHHDDKVEGRALVKSSVDRPIRYALEVRHPSFVDAGFEALLRDHDVAICIADTAGLFPMFDAMTTSFAYVRLHGDTELYASRYGHDTLALWAARIRKWARRGDAYVYFDNDARGHAPFDARALREMLGGTLDASKRACPSSHVRSAARSVSRTRRF